MRGNRCYEPSTLDPGLSLTLSTLGLVTHHPPKPRRPEGATQQAFTHL
jgi:hypothetical protein